MYLKSVKARGFKSFARPVEFAFEPGITVIVGPNGSGKSNISDAVVWAMGEQSPSAVRGATMQDVIFSGSDRMSPSGMAEVELVFDNSCGTIPLDFSEVMVSRRLYRDGDGQYFINKSGCRLIDVGELLSDAGLGRDSHSIISQGKVDAILEGKPTERRAHIEEAAGLGKFKKRRRRAERKLARVKDNLDRLSDVEEEVKANLRPLKRQATAAERSTKLDNQIAVARARLIKGEILALEEDLARAEDASRRAAERRRHIEQQLAQAAAERRDTEEKLAESLSRHKETASQYYRVKAERQGTEQVLEAVEKRRSLLEQAGKRAGARIGNLEGQIERVSAELERARGDQEEGSLRREKIESELSARQEELSRLEAELEQQRKAGEEHNRRLGELGALRERYSHQLEFLSQRRQKLAADIENAGAAIAQAEDELGSQEQALEEDRRLLGEAGHKLSQARERVKELSAAADSAEERWQQTSIELRRVGEDQKIAKARLTFIGENGHSGLSEAARELIDEKQLQAVVDLMQVEPGYEKAVSAVMGRMLFALAVSGAEEAAGLMELVRGREAGAVEFLLPGGGEDFRKREGGDYLIDHVSLPEEWESHIGRLLDGVRVVDRIPAGGMDTDESWVTPDGVIYQAERRMLSCRSRTPTSLALKQRNERRKLEGELRRAEQRLGVLEREREELERRRDEARRERDDSRTAAQEAARALKGLEEALAAGERRQRVLAQELELGQQKLEHYQAEEEKLRQQEGETRRKLADTESSMAELGAEGETGPDAGKEKADRRAELAGEVTRLQIEAARVREREHVAVRTIERVAPALERLRDELRLSRFRVAVSSRFLPVCGRLISANSRLAQVYGNVMTGMEQKMKEAESLSERYSAALKELSRSEADLQQQLSQASDSSTESEVGVSKLRDQLAEQQAQLEELEGRFGGAGVGEAEPAPPQELDEVRTQLERLQRRRENIGPVNPLAQKEYEEMLERQNFLKEQRQDLEQSMTDLLGLIRELTERIESTFNETFEAVKRNFSEVVATLFPGGEGRLSIVEPEAAGAGETAAEPAEGEDEDMLTEEEEEDASAGISIDRRGIEISVKPARKAVRSLSLFSGGERSLVAIAFLFSIFLARPAPFYILDEVEAALDDTNIDRLLNMLRSFQDRTQFIVITHQKRTMEVADTLYGVSMGSDGTSKVLSRRMTGDKGGPSGGREDGDEAAAGGERDGSRAAALAG